MHNAQTFISHDFLRFDLFAGLILIGAFQGAFLFILLLSKPKKQPFNNLIFAALVFSASLILLEIFLGYSGLITHALFLVDFSEPLAFVVGPLIFLLIRSMGGEAFTKKEWIHFLPFVCYLFYHIPFLLESDAIKYNSFIWAFHPEESPMEAVRKFPFDPFHIRRNLMYFIMFHFGTYMLLAYFKGKSLKKKDLNNPYFFSWIRFFLIFFVITVMLYSVIKFKYQNDLGDHLLAIYITGWLFFFSYKMLTDSHFFQPVIKLKYEKSSLSEQNKQYILKKLSVLEQTEFYADPSLSLAKLAKQLGTTPHYVSQVLNEEVGKTYFEYISQFRVDKARKLLVDPTTRYFTIEEIAERSGYLSKSAFNTAFKKTTGTTPGAFRNSAEDKSTAL